MLVRMSERDRLLAALGDYFGAHPELPVDAVYLFGSHAAGRAHRESDVDVAVLLDWSRAGDAATRFDLRVELASHLISALRHAQVDVIVLNDAPPLLGRHIVRSGVRAFCRDGEADHAYRRDVQLRAADLAPFLQRHRQRLLERMTR
jgi:predicted nucleotidyltransferase